MMHWGDYGAMGYGGAGLGWVFMILFWALVILGIIHLVKKLTGNSKEAGTKESAEDILKKRFAAGEIAIDEYNDKMSIINKH